MADNKPTVNQMDGWLAREVAVEHISMSNELAAPADVSAAIHNATATKFLLALLAASILPIVFFAAIFAGRSVLPPQFIDGGIQLFVFLAVAHVPITAFFWVDNRYRTHMNANWQTYYLVPAIIIALCGSVPVLTGTEGTTYLFLVYFVWLLWHYGKQNWGILCLFSFGTKSPMPSKLERWICNSAPAAGVMGAFARLQQAQESIFHPILPLLYWIGAIGTAAVVSATVYVVIGQVRNKISPLRICMTIVAGLFFVPSFLTRDSSIISYASAHAAQYFVMMYGLASDRKQKATALRLAAITLIAAVGYFFASGLRDPSIVGGAVTVSAAIAIGITMCHFFLDSHLWRLREPFQRGAVKESFDFLFH